MVAIAIGTVTACSSASPTVSLRLVQSASVYTSGMEGLLTGSLTVDLHGCVLAETDSHAIVVPVWPLGYSVTGDTKSFQILDGNGAVVATSGTTLSIGGGGADRVEQGWTEPGCSAGKRLWIVGVVRPA